MPKSKNAYISFCITERPIVKTELPRLNSRQITSELGRRWREQKKVDDAPSPLTFLFFYLCYVLTASAIHYLFFYKETRVYTKYTNMLPNPYDNVYPWQLPLLPSDKNCCLHPHYVFLLAILAAIIG
jgi:hypothetical protein